MTTPGQISGMTGFARVEGVHEGVRWTWEAKSVNGRALDLKLRLPAGFDALDPIARAAAAKRFKRASLQVNLSLIETTAQSVAVRVDHDLARRLIEEGRRYVESGEVRAPSWDGLLQVRGVVVADDVEHMSEEARAALEAALAAGVERAFDALAEARLNEGRMLTGVLTALLDRLDALVAAARSSAAAAPAAALARLRQRLAALSPDVQADPQRLAQEAALIAQRADVQEELDRLTAHAAEARALLIGSEPAGRRFDFLAQELTREANTLCSKSSEIELTRIGLDVKAVIDQIKEQAANVE